MVAETNKSTHAARHGCRRPRAPTGFDLQQPDIDATLYATPYLSNPQAPRMHAVVGDGAKRTTATERKRRESPI